MALQEIDRKQARDDVAFDVDMLPRQIAFTAPAPVMAAIGRIGRTEDVHLSPDRRRLAVAGFLANTILVLDSQSAIGHGGSNALSFSAALELTSSSLGLPHGVVWLTSDTIAVANREGEVVIFGVPATRDSACHQVRLEPVSVISAEAGGLEHPGSVAAVELGEGLYEIIVCNNSGQHVTHHLVDARDGFRLVSSRRLLTQGFKIPDGVAFCDTTKWLAVSNHYEHAVYLYQHDGTLASDAQPAGTLVGANYPHGVRFAADGRLVFVADAGGREVQVFLSADGNWHGEHRPIDSMRTIREEAFLAGNVNDQEGGSKGIEILGDTGILVATCEELPLAFFDISHLLQKANSLKSPSRFGHDSKTRRAIRVLSKFCDTGESMDTQLRLELLQAREHIDALNRSVANLESEIHVKDAHIGSKDRRIAALLKSRSWRMSAPLRMLSNMSRRLLHV